MKKAIVLISLMILVGCTSADRAKFGSLGSRHKITLYSGGIAVKVWHSTGYINNEEHSDGYYFMDDATGKLIRVSGNIVIEQE